MTQKAWTIQPVTEAVPLVASPDASHEPESNDRFQELRILAFNGVRKTLSLRTTMESPSTAGLMMRRKFSGTQRQGIQTLSCIIRLIHTGAPIQEMSSVGGPKALIGSVFFAISASLLRNPRFRIGAWYAKQRSKLLALPFDSTEWFNKSSELGDALTQGLHFIQSWISQTLLYFKLMLRDWKIRTLMLSDGYRRT